MFVWGVLFGSLSSQLGSSEKFEVSVWASDCCCSSHEVLLGAGPDP